MTDHFIPTCLIAIFLSMSACSSVPSAEDVESWQTQTIAAQRNHSKTLIRELRAIDKIRAVSLDLEESRSRCFSLLKRFPDSAPVLWRAAQAESDYVLILKSRKATKWQRNLAALSSLKFVRRAQAVRGNKPSSAVLVGQLSWSMGNSTHLKGMFSRAGWARQTLETAQQSLALDPKETRALATLSILHLRLATLPDIIKVMAMGAPKGQIKESIKYAKRCVELQPSLQHNVLLARAYLAAEEYQKADDQLQQALKRSDRFPRDRYYRVQAMQVLDDTLREINRYRG